MTCVCYQVCLQFPDELLGDAAAVAKALTSQLGQLVYILGDTTYGRSVLGEYPPFADVKV